MGLKPIYPDNHSRHGGSPGGHGGYRSGDTGGGSGADANSCGKQAAMITATMLAATAALVYGWVAFGRTAPRRSR
jgi:hypothetical protein